VTGAACARCGLPVAPGPVQATDAPRFCCSGCCIAHHLGQGGTRGAIGALAARLVLSAFLAMGVMVFSLSLYGELLPGGDPAERASESAAALRGLSRLGALALSAPVLYLLGLPLLDAVVRMRRWLSADALILFGTAAAWTISAWNTMRGGGHVYFETATMVLVLVGLGRWLDVRARERARSELRAILPERTLPAAVLRDGDEVELDPAELAPGDLVRVRPGEVLPVDGVVVEGRSFLDTSAMTGEEAPRTAGAGERVLAGCTVVDGTLVVRAEAVGAGRVRDEIERLLARSMQSRGRHMNVADRAAWVLLPLAFAIAVAAGLFHGVARGPEAGLLAALSVALISCPCALGIATPLAFWIALGASWRAGVLVRDDETLERLARARRVFFDKTGTLTAGELELEDVLVESAESVEPLAALRLAAALELGSEHAVGRGLRRAWLERSGAVGLGDLPAVEDFRALPGLGVEGLVEGRRGRVVRDGGESGLIALEIEGRVLARFAFRARPRAEARALIDALRAAGFELLVLTGDAAGPSRELAQRLGIAFEAGLLPGDKVARIERAGRRGTVFVGDGLNDAAALAAADVGVAMAGGSARSLDVAPVALLRPGLSALPELLRLARSTVRVARGNLVWAFAYNGIGLWLAAAGRLTPIVAAAAMVASSLAVVLNSSRIARDPN